MSNNTEKIHLVHVWYHGGYTRTTVSHRDSDKIHYDTKKSKYQNHDGAVIKEEGNCESKRDQ